MWHFCRCSCPFGFPAPGPAATTKAEEPDFTTLSFEELVGIKIPTVYGASKHEQKITEAPATVSIITRDDFQLFGHRALADALRSVRGFYVTGDRAYTYLGLRGVNRPGDYGGGMLLMIDGQRLNDPVGDQAFNGGEFPLDVDLIERVEVIRGPGSSLYGNNAFFGVITSSRGADVICKASKPQPRPPWTARIEQRHQPDALVGRRSSDQQEVF